MLTVLVLLRKEANSPNLAGIYERFLPDGRPTNRYNYDVIRLWKEPAESFLDAGVELVPLAPLCDVAGLPLPDLIRMMADRINPLSSGHAAKLWTASYLLMGLRYPDELIANLLEGVQAVKDSTTYQKILRDGRAEGLVEGRMEGLAEGRTAEARRMLLFQGTIRFGAPDDAARAALEDISDIDRLEELGKCVLDADVRDWNSWLGSA